MSRTLSDLRDEISALIKMQGDDAPVAAFVFTKDDVFGVDEKQNPKHLPIDDAKAVLEKLDQNVYFYDQAQIFITEEVFFINSNKK
jgi:hypothetical protein